MDELQKAVTLKGTNDGWRLLIDDQASYTEIDEALEELIENIHEDHKQKKDYYLTITTGNRLLDSTKIVQIKKMIERETSFQVKHVESNVIEKTLAEQYAEQAGMELAVRNVRNGQILESDKDLLLIGKVFPGGIVRSKGHVIVIGEMNGTIQAGFAGNEEAIIVNNFAFDAQVRIADHVEVIENDEDSEEVKDYEVLLVNDMYVMERVSPRQLKEYRPDIVEETGGLTEWLEQL